MFGIRINALSIFMGMMWCATANSTIISVDQTITFTDPPTYIIADNNPFDFLFSGLPTIALTDAQLNFFGLGDFGTDSENFSVLVDGVAYGTFFPSGEAFAESLTISLADLSSFIADGSMLVRISLGSNVNLPFEGDSFSTRLTFRADDTPVVPVPATLALFGLGLAGLGWSRRKKA